MNRAPEMPCMAKQNLIEHRDQGAWKRGKYYKVDRLTVYFASSGLPASPQNAVGIGEMFLAVPDLVEPVALNLFLHSSQRSTTNAFMSLISTRSLIGTTHVPVRNKNNAFSHHFRYMIGAAA